MRIESESRHQCLIYDGPPSRQLQSLAAMMQSKLTEGFRCLYLNSSPMVAGLRSCLVARGLDVESEVAKGRLILSSEPVTSLDGGFDVKKMIFNLEEALNQALNDGYQGLWATGDMTWEFGDEKNFAKLMDYEWQLEELFEKRKELCGVCQYHRDTLPQAVMRQGVLTHQTFFINETLAKVSPYVLSGGLTNEAPPPPFELDEMIAALCRSPRAERG